MPRTTFEEIKEGDEIGRLAKPPITRTTLALFAGASNDHNPVHLDIDVAKAAGMDDVFAQGMLSMAYLGQVLTNWVPQHQIRSYGVRFGAITHLNDEISCTGTVVEKFSWNGENCVRLGLQAASQDGDVKLQGEAV
ncbi:MAG: dehydratase, partial [Gammaproteobacteria bacterium]|nr:dehydratase [Gammaproteobacteria bacterium]